MDNPQPRFVSLAAKTMVCHTITYVIMGVLAAYFLNYAALMARPDSGMRPMTDPLVIAGPLLIALGILGTFGPAAGSMEGMIYTPVPIRSQLRGWVEVVPQAVLLSALLCYWVNHPAKKWLSWLLGSVFFIMMALSVLGLLMRKT